MPISWKYYKIFLVFLQVALLYSIEIKSVKLTTEVKRDALVELHQKDVFALTKKADKKTKLAQCWRYFLKS